MSDMPSPSPASGVRRRTVSADGRSWHGVDDGDVARFRGITYAHSSRFAAPSAADGIDYDGTEPGPIPPQSASRLEAVQGAPEALRQAEGPLVLSVFAPVAGLDGIECQRRRRERVPVVVFLHGGAYLSGSGEWAMYDGTRLASEGGVVVVTVSSRLGVLGYPVIPGLSPGNLGLLDQIAALEWVRDHIAAFGGDPDLVTLMGQSAGGQAALGLLGVPRTQGLFRRLMVQSANLGLGFHEIHESARRGGLVADQIPGAAASADPTLVLRAQQRVTRQLAGPGGLNSAPPFLPVWGVDPLPERDRWLAEMRSRAGGLDILIGWTREEINAFWDPHPLIARLNQLPLFGPPAVKMSKRRLRQKVFTDPAWELADDLAGNGARTWVYELGRLHPDSAFGACHTIDLPLLLGTAASWTGSPMLTPLSVADVFETGTRMRAMWAAFIATGDIGEPAWHVHAPRSRTAYPLP